MPSVSPVLKESKVRETHSTAEQILEVARELFGDDGYDATSIAEIPRTRCCRQLSTMAGTRASSLMRIEEDSGSAAFGSNEGRSPRTVTRWPLRSWGQ